MAVDLCLLLLLSLSILAIINPRLVSADLSAAVSPFPAGISSTQQQQLNNIIDALVGAGDFGTWANLLSVIDPSTFPLTATLFIPSDDALSKLPTPPPLDFDPLIFPYHIVPQQLSFSDLQSLKIGSRFPTLLPTKSIVVTNNSSTNFTIDDIKITHPDLYINGAISVHGIESLLNYSAYGGGPLEYQFPIFSPDSKDSPRVFTPLYSPAEESTGRHRSDALCLCAGFPIILSVVCAAFAFKIHRNPLIG